MIFYDATYKDRFTMYFADILIVSKLSNFISNGLFTGVLKENYDAKMFFIICQHIIHYRLCVKIDA